MGMMICCLHNSIKLTCLEYYEENLQMINISEYMVFAVYSNSVLALKLFPRYTQLVQTFSPGWVHLIQLRSQ